MGFMDTLMSELRLGIMGMSDGNGHPYSWAAICNGYHPEAMADCPFPVIPRYLAGRAVPGNLVEGARVTHVWTQDRKVSEHIASASRINTVVDGYTEMIGHVDAVLLARDDAENHLRMSGPFIEAGLPVYIDKPIALDRQTLDAILALEQYPGQVFSCSAVRYAREMQVTKTHREEMGGITAVYATTPKTWRTYAAHIVEPVLAALGDPGEVAASCTFAGGGKTIVIIEWSSGVAAVFAALGSSDAPLQMTVHGTKKTMTYSFSNTYDAFKASLEAFVQGVRQGRQIIGRREFEQVVDIIERGMKKGA